MIAAGSSKHYIVAQEGEDKPKYLLYKLPYKDGDDSVEPPFASLDQAMAKLKELEGVGITPEAPEAEEAPDAES